MPCPFCHTEPHSPSCIDYLPPRVMLPTPPLPPAQAHSATSVAAAMSVVDRTGAMRERVLAYLKAREGGATDEEMQDALGMNPNTQRPRRIELVQAGLVVGVGTGTTRSGRSATTWFASEKAPTKPIEKKD